MRAVRGAVVARMGTVTTTQPLAAHALGRFAHPAGGSSGGGSGYAGDAACVYDRSATGASTGPQGGGGSRGGRADGPCSTRSTAAGLGFAMHGLVGVRGMASNKVHENVRPVLTADMRRIVDIGGMKAEAIAKMPANRPVVAELGGAKISPSVLHSMLQTLRQLKQTNRLIEVCEKGCVSSANPRSRKGLGADSVVAQHGATKDGTPGCNSVVVQYPVPCGGCGDLRGELHAYAGVGMGHHGAQNAHLQAFRCGATCMQGVGQPQAGSQGISPPCVPSRKRKRFFADGLERAECFT
jgi:hypothetical protein